MKILADNLIYHLPKCTAYAGMGRKERWDMFFGDGIYPPWVILTKPIHTKSEHEDVGCTNRQEGDNQVFWGATG